MKFIFNSICVFCKYLFPSVISSAPFIEIVLGSVIIPFSGIILIFPGGTCDGGIAVWGKAVIAFGYTFIYAVYFYFFRYLVIALAKKDVKNLTDWMKMKVLFLGYQIPVSIILFSMAEDKCLLPHLVSVMICTIFSIFSLLLVGIYRKELIKGFDNPNSIAMASFDLPAA